MKFSIERALLVKAVSQAQSVVERRNTIPILANVLIEASPDGVSFRATDLDTEVVDNAAAQVERPGATTVSASMLNDIARKLPDGALVGLELEPETARLTVQAGRSTFSLATLPREDFPVMSTTEYSANFSAAPAVLRRLFDKSKFAISNEETRYYLNGVYLHVASGDNGPALRCVATDGHRLALCEAALDDGVATKRQIIVPRKGVQELQRLLEGGERTLELEMGRSHIRVKRDDVTFTSKLIDGRFPDYEAVIPIGADREVRIDREVLRAALQRAAILSNEKYRGVRLEVSPGQLRINAHNPEQEEAQEEVEAETRVDDLAVGFNVNYLLDALTALRDEQVVIALRDANSSALVREASSDKCRHVVMPLRL